MGPYLCMLITLFHLCGFLVKKCIFDKGFSRKNRSINIIWLCCLKITDPYDVEVYQMKKKRKYIDKLQKEKTNKAK